MGKEEAEAKPPGGGENEARATAMMIPLASALAKPKEERTVSKGSQHVIAHPDGGWSVKKGGSTHATKRFETQKEAINYGRKISKAQGSELYVHGRDGMIRSWDSNGNDPNPPKDKR